MNIKEMQDIQKDLAKIQNMANKALRHLEQGHYKRAGFFFNVTSSFQNDLSEKLYKLSEKYENSIKETEEVMDTEIIENLQDKNQSKSD